MLLNGLDYVIGGLYQDAVAYATGGLVSGAHTPTETPEYVDADHWPQLLIEKVYPFEVAPASDFVVQLYPSPTPWRSTYTRMLDSIQTTHLISGLERSFARSILPYRSGLTSFVLETLTPGVPVTVNLSSGPRLTLGEVARSGSFTVIPTHGRTSVGIRLEAGYNAVRIEQGGSTFTFFAVVARWATWIEAIAREMHVNGDGPIQQAYSDFLATFSAMFVDNVSPILKVLPDAQSLRIIHARMAQYAMTVLSGTSRGVQRMLSAVVGTEGLIVPCSSEALDTLYDWSALHSEVERSYSSEATVWPINVSWVRRALFARMVSNAGHEVTGQTPRRIDVVSESGPGWHWFDHSSYSLAAAIADEPCCDPPIAYTASSRLHSVIPSTQFEAAQIVDHTAGMGARYLDCDSELDSDTNLDYEEEYDLGGFGWLGFDVTAHAVEPVPCVCEPVTPAVPLENGVACWLRGPPCVPMTALTVYVDVVEPDIQYLLDVLPY